MTRAPKPPRIVDRWLHPIAIAVSVVLWALGYLAYFVWRSRS